VFVVTNVATGIAAVVGLAMTVAMRARERRRDLEGPWRGGGSVPPAAAPRHASALSRRAGAV
jgi:hypothetical protein